MCHVIPLTCVFIKFVFQVVSKPVWIGIVLSHVCFYRAKSQVTLKQASESRSGLKAEMRHSTRSLNVLLELICTFCHLYFSRECKADIFWPCPARLTVKFSSLKSLLPSTVWSYYRPAGRMRPATAFSVARGSIQEKCWNLKVIEKCVRLHWSYWIVCAG